MWQMCVWIFLSLVTFYFGLLSAITFSKKKFCNFGGHLIGLKTIENLHGDDQKMATAT